jgi:hypothetical protein
MRSVTPVPVMSLRALRRVQRAPRPRVQTLAGACLLAAVLAACGGHSSGKQASSLSEGTVSSSPADELIGYLFPVQPSDDVEAANYLSFFTAAQDKLETVCLAADDMPGPPIPPGDPDEQPQTPNLPLIRKQQTLLFNVTPPVNPPRMSAAKRRAYDARLKSCMHAAFKQVTGPATGGSSGNALSEEWLQMDYEKVSAMPSVIAAGKRAQSCALAHGYQFDPVNGSDYIMGAITLRPIGYRPSPNNHVNVANEQTGSQFQRRIAAVYITCITPLVQTRLPLLQAARRKFLADNALQVRQLQASVTAAVRQLGARFAIHLG